MKMYWLGEEGSGKCIITLADAPREDGFIPIVDWTGTPNGVRPDMLHHYTFIGQGENIPDLINACKSVQANTLLALAAALKKVGAE